MPTLANALDFSKYEARNLRGHQLGTAPSSPVTGQLYYNTVDNTLWWWDGSVWQSAKGGAGGTPPATTTTQGTIQLAGDITGTATSVQIATGVIVDTDVAAANKDGTAGTPSLRTLGTGGTQAAAGNDSRFTDARTPTAHATTHQPGGSDPMAVDAVVATGSLRTLGAGAQQAMPGNRTLDAITAPVAAVSLNNQRISNLATPIGVLDAASKGYVDGIAQGLDVKNSCRAASTANVNTSSPGATLDGVTLVVGDRILLKDQTTGSQNGIWVWNGAAVGVTRATDADVSAEMTAGMFTFIEEGTANADSGWVLTTNQPITLDTTPLVFAQFSGAGMITAGAGLTKTGNSLDVGAGSGITVNADSIQITTGGVTQAMLAFQSVVYYSSATHGAGATITITQATHGCRASRGLLVQCQIDATGAVILPDISVAANGDVTITFGASQTANTIRTTIIG